MVLLQGPTRALFLVSEIPLYKSRGFSPENTTKVLRNDKVAGVVAGRGRAPLAREPTWIEYGIYKTVTARFWS